MNLYSNYAIYIWISYNCIEKPQFIIARRRFFTCLEKRMTAWQKELKKILLNLNMIILHVYNATSDWFLD